MNRTVTDTRATAGRGRSSRRGVTMRAASGLTAVALAVALAACGSDDDDAAADPVTTEGADGGTDATAPADTGTDDTGTDDTGTDDTGPGPATTASGSDDAAGDGPEADAAAAAARVEGALQPIVDIGVDVPLTETPPTDVTVAWIGGGLQNAQPITPGYRAATEALGWELVIIDFDPADPQTVNAAVQQAVDQDVDYIGISGTAVASFEQAAQAAVAKGIPIIDMYSTNETTGAEGNGIYAVISDAESTRTTARQVSDWVIADSEGTANAVMINLPEFPILQIAAESAREHMAAECAECAFAELDVTLNDLVSGAIPAAVVSYLQNNPDTNYVYFIIGDLFGGVAEAVATAGLEGQAKFVGGSPNTAQVQSLIDEESEVWAVLPREQSAWHAVDAMARLSIGQDLSGVNPVLQTALWDQSNVPNPVEDYRGAEGFEDTFKTLWGV